MFQQKILLAPFAFELSDDSNLKVLGTLIHDLQITWLILHSIRQMQDNMVVTKNVTTDWNSLPNRGGKTGWLDLPLACHNWWRQFLLIFFVCWFEKTIQDDYIQQKIDPTLIEEKMTEIQLRWFGFVQMLKDAPITRIDFMIFNLMKRGRRWKRALEKLVKKDLMVVEHNC